MKCTIVFQKNWEASKNKRYIINQGSSRSSKTFSIFQLFYLYAFQHPNKRLSVWRDTKKDCKDTVLADMRKAFIGFENYRLISFNKTESIFTFPNGSTIEICGTDDEEKIHGFQGDVLWLNEPYKISRDTFDQLDMRTTGFVIIDWNPKKSHWIDDLIKNPKSTVIHSTFKDNPFCPEEQRIKILSYEPKAENIKNGTADKFKWEVYGLGIKSEKPNRIYKGWGVMSLQDFIDLPYNSYFGNDFGTTNPNALVEVKFDGQNTFFVRKRLYKPISEMPFGLSKEIEDLGINKKEIIVCDPADMENRLDLVRNGFNIIAAHKPAGSVIAGINLLNKFRIFYVEDDDITDEYENYEWEIINGVNLDRPLKQNDHLMDAIRYCITWLCKYLNVK